MRKFKEFGAVYLIGSTGYSLLEILWRGYTHWTMALTGGTCFYCFYKICRRFTSLKLWKKCMFGSLMITSIEFSVGCIVNKLLHMNVWDYSDQPLNVFGQICAFYSFLWFLLCFPLVSLCNVLKKQFVFPKTDAPVPAPNAAPNEKRVA